MVCLWRVLLCALVVLFVPACWALFFKHANPGPYAYTSDLVYTLLLSCILQMFALHDWLRFFESSSACTLAHGRSSM
eukprot:COSAG02_NODE_380_length_23483_cov_8.034382_4_plen_77_part_00